MILDYSDCKSPEKSRSGNFPDISELQEQDLYDDDENSLSDVIPFSDSEYEKIAVDCGSQTEDLLDSPSDSGRMCDSALGRSVSDQGNGGALLLKTKMENHHDIGYSSESHSNEEQEVNLTGMLASSKVGSQSRPHSMTSAYDTSSNCSDHVESGEGEETEATRQKVESLCRSPSKQYYKVL